MVYRKFLDSITLNTHNGLICVYLITMYRKINMTSIGDITVLTVIAGVFIGIVGRTVLRFLEKLRAAEETGEQFKFSLKFLITAVIGFITAIAPTVILFPVVMEKIGPAMGGLALPAILIISAMTAYGTNEAVNYSVKVTENSIKASQNRLSGNNSSSRGSNNQPQ